MILILERFKPLFPRYFNDIVLIKKSKDLFCFQQIYIVVGTIFIGFTDVIVLLFSTVFHMKCEKPTTQWFCLELLSSKDRVLFREEFADEVVKDKKFCWSGDRGQGFCW